MTEKRGKSTEKRGEIPVRSISRVKDTGPCRRLSEFFLGGILTILFMGINIRSLKRMYGRVRGVCFSEYGRIFRDQAVLTFFFGVQIIYPVVYPVPAYHQLVREVPVAAVDMDNSALSRQVIRMADASEAIKVTERPRSLEEAKYDFYMDRVKGIIVVPADFNKKILKGEQASVAVYADASYFLIYRQVYSASFQAVGTFSAGVEMKKMMAKGIPRQQAAALRDPVPAVFVPMYNTMGGYGSYLIPAVLILILQQTLLLGIGVLGGTASERNEMHFMLPQSERDKGIVTLLLGKALAYFSLFSIHVFYFFSIVFRFYGYPQKANILSIYLYFIPFLLAIIFLGLALSTLFKTRESAIVLILCTSIPFIMFSGFSWPSISIPAWLDTIAKAIPTTTGIGGFIRLNMVGARFSEILDVWFFQWGLAAVYFFISVYAFRRLMEGRSSLE